MPVLACDEFLELAAVEPALPAKASTTDDRSQEQADDTFRGLCYDCRNRKGCRMVRMTQGGVSHCGKYR
jgi:hypothetical protein